MGNFYFWLRVAELVAVLVTLTVCTLKISKDRYALYFKLYLCGAACTLLFLIYDVVILFCGVWRMAAEISYVGFFGCGFFLLSANFGQMNGLLDERGSRMHLRRCISLIAPIVLLSGFGILVFKADVSLSFKIAALIAVLPGAAAAYFHLKHLILPTDGLGLIPILKAGNIYALGYILFSTLYVATWTADIHFISNFAALLFTVFVCLMSIQSVRGAKKWKTSI